MLKNKIAFTDHHAKVFLCLFGFIRCLGCSNSSSFTIFQRKRCSK